MTVPQYQLSEIDFSEAETQAVIDVMRSKWLSLGPKTAEFEQALAEFLDVKHVVAVSNCTAALHLALLACGIGPGDEVLVPSYTFVASVNPIRYVGAQPVFVDIPGPHDLNLDVKDVEAKVTSRTKAVIAVHIAGFPAELDCLMRIAGKYGLAIIEDACHAIGAHYEGPPGSAYSGRMAGSVGAFGCFSFFANKNLVTGEGGAMATNDADLAYQARLARSHGMTKSSWDKASGRATDYDVAMIGFNYRCTELTAAIGLVQLAKLPELNLRRRKAAHHYHSRLQQVDGLFLPFSDRTDAGAHHILPVLVEASQRSLFRQRLTARGIQTSVHYPPVHGFTHYRKICSNMPSLPNTEQVSAREVTLPLHPLLVESDVDVICDVVQQELLELRH